MPLVARKRIIVAPHNLIPYATRRTLLIVFKPTLEGILLYASNILSETCLTDLAETNLIITGIDEAGRGPLAGPVVAAAVILDPYNPIIGLADSKKLSEKKRNLLAVEIKAKALHYGIGQAEHHEIDEINILNATLLAMQRAFAQLDTNVDLALVDGNKSPELPCRTEAIIKGDSKIPAISAASILAKTTRDQLMQTAHQNYPRYGFNQHKGYPTKAHREIIRQIGLCEIHRKSFSWK